MKRSRAAYGGTAGSIELIAATFLPAFQARAANAIIGTAADETLRGTDAADLIRGNFGNDLINGGGGDDVLQGGAGDDILNGGAGYDRINGGSGRDTVTYANNQSGVVLDYRDGGTRQDAVSMVERIIGGSGDDVLVGPSDQVDAQWRSVIGGGGDDVIGGAIQVAYGDEGDDVIGGAIQAAYGGEGDDLVYAAKGAYYSWSVLDGGLGDHDVLSLSELGTSSNSQSLVIDISRQTFYHGYYGSHPHDEDVESFTGFEGVIGGDHGNAFTGDAGAVTLRGGAGRDYFYWVSTDGYTDQIDGAGGNDYIFLGSGSSTVFGGDGDDSISFIAINDLPAVLELHGGTGSDRLFVNGSKATTADMGLQQFLVQGQRAISFDGFEGIITGAGNDVLRGSDGADYLSGATGSDVLTGGRGADILATSAYVIGDIDRFTDFDRSEGDRIDVSSIDAKIHPKHAPRDDDFDFIGTAEFDGLKGQLRYEVLDGSAFVTGDTNGDAEADFTIVIEGVDELRALDFIL